MSRCFDCFDEFIDGERWAVLKKMRDIVMPDNAPEPKSFFESACYDPVFVCADCAGWYRDHALLIQESSDV